MCNVCKCAVCNNYPRAFLLQGDTGRYCSMSQRSSYLSGLLAVLHKGRNLALSRLLQGAHYFKPHIKTSGYEEVQVPSSLPACEEVELLSDVSDSEC